MSRIVKIAPSILSADFVRLAEEIKAAEDAGVDILHLDIMDGHFVPNITIGPAVVEAIRKITNLPLGGHLMICEPDKFLKDFISAGADFLTVHVEAAIHLHRTIHYIKEREIKAGISLNPATPLWTLDNILNDVDLVLIMSVNPGFGGQVFITSMLEKIKTLRKLIDFKGYNAMIEVDGGVKLDNAQSIAKAGVDILVIGSAFFGSGNYREFMKQLRENLSS
ncbi:MAG: ribulose-phosphate 3-epimerase [Thermodesulfovibrionales bacterium]|nr:ribulose-phosphate 3-epimerase [Thermodesulfovibrionales bacterium]